MPTRIVIDDVAKAVRAVWPAAGGLTMEAVYFNRKPQAATPPYGVIRVVERDSDRESDGVCLQRFDVEASAWVTDPTTTAAVNRALTSLAQRLVDAGTTHWPAGLGLGPDAYQLPDAQLETDPRPRNAVEIYEVKTRFRVVVNPLP